MAGKDDGDAVAVHDRAHGASSARAADALRERAVRGRLPVGHARELVEDRDREGRQLTQVEREVEGAAAAGEVLVELAARARRRFAASGGRAGRRCGRAARGARSGRDRTRSPRGRDPTPRRGDRRSASRRRRSRRRQAERRGGVAEAAVEIGRDGHEVILLRMRRTPVDVACRAASGDEPSADAIWSYERS